MYANLAERLAANVSVVQASEYVDTPCFLWTGNVGNSGYGRMSARCCGKVVKLYSHRVSVELHTGEVIPAGMEVDHRCYQTTCINPRASRSRHPRS